LNNIYPVEYKIEFRYNKKKIILLYYMATQFNQPRTQYDEEQGYQRHLAYLRAQSKNSQGFQDSLRNIALGNEPTADAPRTADEILGDESEVNRRAQSILSKIFTDKPRAQYDPLGAETQEQFEMRAKPSTFLINTMPHAMKVLLITEAPNIIAELKNKAFLTVPTFVNYMHHYRAAYEESGGTSKYITNDKLLGDITALINTLPQRDTIDRLQLLIARIAQQSVLARMNNQAEMKRVIKHVSDKLTILKNGIPSKDDLAQLAASISKGTQDIMEQVNTNELVMHNTRRGLMSQAAAYNTLSNQNASTLSENQQGIASLIGKASEKSAEREALATQTILDRLERLLQNVPTEADLNGRLVDLEAVFERNYNSLAEQSIAVSESVKELEQELEGVSKQSVAAVDTLLANAKKESTLANRVVSASPSSGSSPSASDIANIEKRLRIQLRDKYGRAKGSKLTVAMQKEFEQLLIAEIAAWNPPVPQPALKRGNSLDWYVPMARPASQESLEEEIPISQYAAKRNDMAESQNQTNEYMQDLFGYGLNRKRIDPRHVRFVGRGIALEAEPKKYYEFGKYMISIPHLGNNILKVKYLQNGNEVPSFNSQKISDDLTDFIEDLVDTGKINERHLNKLEAPEKRLFSKLINQSGLYGKFKIRVLKNPNDKAEEDRFELVKGEFIAGNDNPAIVKELKHLIIKFMTEGRIPKNQGHELLFQLSV
jgi:hypothetical protein